MTSFRRFMENGQISRILKSPCLWGKICYFSFKIKVNSRVQADFQSQERSKWRFRESNLKTFPEKHASGTPLVTCTFGAHKIGKWSHFFLDLHLVYPHMELFHGLLGECWYSVVSLHHLYWVYTSTNLLLNIILSVFVFVNRGYYIRAVGVSHVVRSFLTSKHFRTKQVRKENILINMLSKAKLFFCLFVYKFVYIVQDSFCLFYVTDSFVRMWLWFIIF